MHHLQRSCGPRLGFYHFLVQGSKKPDLASTPGVIKSGTSRLRKDRFSLTPHFSGVTGGDAARGTVLTVYPVVIANGFGDSFRSEG